MSAQWVAGCARARALANRRLGTAAARNLAGAAGLDDALHVLAGSPYGTRLHAADTLAAAQRGVADALLWNLRVLAGWLPPAGVRMLRLFAGWFELANVDEQLDRFRRPAGAAAPAGSPVVPARSPGEPPFRLGTLAAAWPLLAPAGTADDLRTALARSVWGDPGTDDPTALTRSLRVTWALRVADGVPAARSWAAGAVALVVARDLAAAAALPPATRRSVDRLLGPAWPAQPSVDRLASAVAPAAAWALRDLRRPDDLWLAEGRWWRRLGTDGAAMTARPGFGAAPVIGVVALLAADAWLVRAALETAAHPPGPARTAALEVLDAVA